MQLHQEPQLQQQLHQERQQQQITTAASVKLLCVWFTTLKNVPRRRQVHMNTLKNWVKFLPRMQPVLFVTPPTKHFVKPALELGWQVYDVPRVNEYGTPYISNMLDIIMNSSIGYDSIFYGFSNGDILFDSSFQVTLEAIARDLTSLPNAPVLIVGQRTNYRILESHTGPLYEFYFIERLRARGELFNTDAEDFFIFTRDYDTNIFRDLVIGRPAYDNFVVSASNFGGVTVIDVTETVTALHQTAPSESKFAGFDNLDARYNYNVIGNYSLDMGHTHHGLYETLFNEERMDIVLHRRRNTTIVQCAHKGDRGCI